MIKKIIKVGLLCALFSWSCVSAYQFYHLLDRVAYKAVVKDEYERFYYRDGTSHYIYACLVIDPNNCKEIPIRKPAFSQSNIGEEITLELLNMEFYGFFESMSILLGTVLLASLAIALIVSFLNWLGESDKGEG